MKTITISELKKNLSKYLNTYMLSGVNEYWIIDPKQENTLKYTFKNSEINQLQSYRKDEVIESTLFKGLNVDIRRNLFD